tara:strand:+ start:177 stop:677 length:501 start_codon:yes stop_codon:yes gene_type:complete
MKKKLKRYLPEILKDMNDRLNTFKSVVEYNSLSTKLKSELISNMFESSISDIVPNAVAPLKDHEPDLFIDIEPLELKTSKTTTTWRGGEYSKRPSNYLLVSYDDSEKDVKWFLLFTNLLKKDWKSSSSKSYYATSIDLNYIVENKNYEILHGDIFKKRIKKHLKCL